MLRSKATTLTRALFQRAAAQKYCFRPQGVSQQTTAFVHTSPWLPHSTVTPFSKKTELKTLHERGVWIDTMLQHARCPRAKTLAIARDGRRVNIEWEDGRSSSIHAMWLRHNCHCPECKLDHNGMMITKPEDIDIDIRVISAHIQDDQVLMLKWQYSDSDKTHEGSVPLPHVKLWCDTPASEEERSQDLAMTFFKDKTIPVVEYEEVMDPSDQGLYKWLCVLEERGICLVKNTPREPGTVLDVAKRIGPLQNTVYGEDFNVIAQARPINAAYAPNELAFHHDQVHYESPPGLQLLHCIKFDSNIGGGETLFMDSFELAHQLRRERPDYFDTLTRVPVYLQTIHYDREYPVHVQTKRPLFNLNNHGELVAVMWNPMITVLHPKEAEMEAFYEAFKYFFTKVQACESKYSVRLVPGDIMTFNNRRIVHGRNSYEGDVGERWLQGTYQDLSQFRSRLQYFHNLLGDGQHVRRVGAQDWE